MIRTKYRVIPLLEYYEMIDNKEKDDQSGVIRNGNEEDEQHNEEKTDILDLDTVKKWMIDSLMSYNQPDFTALQKKYATKTLFFGYNYKYALYKATKAQDINATKCLVLGLDEDVYQEIVSGRLKIDMNQKYKKKIQRCVGISNNKWRRL